MEDKIIEMRLIVEGAIRLHECSSDEYNMIGEALYLLREKLCVCLAIYQSKG